MPGNPAAAEGRQAGLAILSLLLVAYSVLIVQRPLVGVVAVSALVIAYHVWLISRSVREIEASVLRGRADGGSSTAGGDDDVRNPGGDW